MQILWSHFIQLKKITMKKNRNKLCNLVKGLKRLSTESHVSRTGFKHRPMSSSHRWLVNWDPSRGGDAGAILPPWLQQTRSLYPGNAAGSTPRRVGSHVTEKAILILEAFPISTWSWSSGKMLSLQRCCGSLQKHPSFVWNTVIFQLFVTLSHCYYDYGNLGKGK